ncbi:hypothetical protein LSTR_LSTR004030 [Laodelphax striatellus]|uniref:Tyrosine--tRNA ligase n=1 Tax=Laodelphax striatellus TaxID=195883 RepID=A0A482WFB3_LAOST|nr:hypothetical protein LSTR_LSTR004030 [Laodelphax striatellus]
MLPLSRTLRRLLDKQISIFKRHYTNRNVLSLGDRGIYKDVFPNVSVKEIVDLLNSSPQCVYSGFDPTASSLHLGNLLVLINLLHWQRAGHQVIALVGGATGSIGDPSGRSKERELQSAEIVAENSRSVTENIKTIFDNHKKYFWDDKKGQERLKRPIIVNNIDWYKEMNALEYVGRIGKHFRMGTMLCKESVDTRLKSEHGISYTEFSYQIFQAYDWYHLLQKYNCRFQAGGSDQLGNISAGHELISRLSKKEVYGLTLPLVKTVSGAKFGKSAGNAVWLSADMTSPFDFYQYLVRTADADVETMLKLFTFDSVDAIADTCRKHQTRPELWLAQKRLADQVTKLVHGEEGLRAAHLATEALYNSNVDILSRLSWNDVASVFKGAVVKDMLLEPGLSILQFSLLAGCFPNEQDARRIIAAGGFSINYQKVVNQDELLSDTVHILPNKITLARVGKRNYWVIRWAS